MSAFKNVIYLYLIFLIYNRKNYVHIVIIILHIFLLKNQCTTKFTIEAKCPLYFETLIISPQKTFTNISFSCLITYIDTIIQ